MDRKKILLVEDQADLIEMLKLSLEAIDYEIITAADGEEGLKKTRKESPNLILLDVMMPKMNGYQVCRELKKDEATKKIPVIMLTAKGQQSDKFWGKETGADEYVTKPFDMDELMEKIRGLLNS